MDGVLWGMLGKPVGKRRHPFVVGGRNTLAPVTRSW